ncbi:MAG: TIGR03667 family PPOX class F420-dependent oxidoreductase [Anaerolineales bacterium]|nr:TIGR03667 family PPOX class F420-dependent oxidoreductase [Anaerolineales bacterium]
MIDLTTEFGRRAARRLEEERIIWLTTVDTEGMPQPRPVWFWWDGQTFLIYSQPNTHKLHHIARNPQVALHFDGDGQGGNIIVFSGEARVAPELPPANQVPAYVQKYQPGFTRIRMSAKEFAESYSVALRVMPTSLRGH